MEIYLAIILAILVLAPFASALSDVLRPCPVLAPIRVRGPHLAAFDRGEKIRSNALERARTRLNWLAALNAELGSAFTLAPLTGAK